MLSAISIEKDVDGFHPLNIGRLAMKGREPLFAPCTPLGCIELLERWVTCGLTRSVLVKGAMKGASRCSHRASLGLGGVGAGRVG